MSIALFQDIFQIMIWIVGLILIGLILLQGGAGDVSSAFGGGGQLDSALGVGANRKLAKITGWLAFFFLLMIVVLAMPRNPDFRRDEAAAETQEGLHPSLEEPADPGFSPDPVILMDEDAVDLPEEDAGAALDASDTQPALPEQDEDSAPTSSGISFGDDDDADEDDEAPTDLEEESP